MMKLPEDFLNRMQTLLKDEYEIFLQSITNEEPTRGLRINTRKIKVEDFLNSFDTSLKQVPFDENFYFIPHHWLLGNHPYFHGGAMYLQEPSAALPALSVEVKEDFKVLDLCAAPGGKTSQILSKLNSGFLIANEINFNRAKVLAGNIERLGYQNAIVTNNKPEDFLKDYKNFFDLVIVDAPCSGEGMFRKDEEAIKNWNITNVLSCAIRQNDILKVAAQLVKQKGQIVYSTCTYAIEENEEVVKNFLREHPDFKLVEVRDEVKQNTSPAIDLEYARRVWPHKNIGEGHFIAVMENTLETAVHYGYKYPRSKISSSVIKELKEELGQVIVDINYHNIYLLKDNFHLIPFSLPPIDNLKVMLAGVKVGSFNKYRRFMIDHQLSHAFSISNYKNVINYSLEDSEVSDYLAGYEIITSQIINKEYALISVNGVALGFGKNVSGTIKNYYPKGLRNLVKKFEKY